MKDRLKSTIIKNKYLVYFLIGLIGIFFIGVAGFVLNSETKWYDIFLGIGCSIVATAGIIVILLLLLSSSEQNQDDLNEWGSRKYMRQDRI